MEQNENEPSVPITITQALLLQMPNISTSVVVLSIAGNAVALAAAQ